MDVSIFKKMKVKPALVAKTFYEPANYPKTDELD